MRVEALPGVLGIRGEGLFIFRELGSTSKYFKGSGEQAGIWGAKEENFKGAEEKQIRELGRGVNFFQGAGSKDPPPPPGRASE